MRTLVIATKNEGKVREIRGALSGLDVSVKGLADFGLVSTVPESGSTFLENAEMKARGYAAKTGCMALADDSGLEVKALGGKPGVFSARYAGEDASDAENNAKLLSAMKEFPPDERKACFVCEMAVADPKGEILFTASGRCSGHIAYKPLGTKGFGYDPVFIPEGFSESFGQLDEKIKRKISHRAAALRQTVDFLGLFYGQST